MEVREGIRLLWLLVAVEAVALVVFYALGWIGRSPW
jgi:hypothetical protein